MTERVYVAATKASPATQTDATDATPAKKAAAPRAKAVKATTKAAAKAPAKSASKAPAKSAAKAAKAPAKAAAKAPAKATRSRAKKATATADATGTEILAATEAAVDDSETLVADPEIDTAAEAVEIDLAELDEVVEVADDDSPAVAVVEAEAGDGDDDESGEPSEKDKASGDFVWDEEESEALRQARKDAELTASADSVRAYLKQIGKVALLNAEEEVELAKRIEAGLYATQRLAEMIESGQKLPVATCSGSAAMASAPRTTCWRPTCASWCRWPSATPAAVWRFWISSRRATWA